MRPPRSDEECYESEEAQKNCARLGNGDGVADEDALTVVREPCPENNLASFVEPRLVTVLEPRVMAIGPHITDRSAIAGGNFQLLPIVHDQAQDAAVVRGPDA
jgi:hypothetical protein